MNILYLDCGMGAAGDMLTAALLELLDEPAEFVRTLNALGIPGVQYRMERTQKCGVTGTHVTVTVKDTEEDDLHVHTHGHTHAQEHTHHHSSLHDIEHLVHDHLALPDNVKADVLAVYSLIAEAESHVHGVPVSDIHFHEVGTMDALADVAAVCLLMRTLSPDKVVVSPVHVGSGSVQCAHGILPVPAPATAYILRGAPVYGGAIEGELCTPTGAALLQYFADAFADMPVMRIQSIGYGMGKKDFPRANCVRALLGETDRCADTVVTLSCNVDDMTAEDIGFAMQRLLDAGAPDVYTVPIGMKKNRPGTMICVLCTPAQKEHMIRLLFVHTSTLGVRENVTPRHTLNRHVETIQTPYGAVRRKTAEGYGVKRDKLEFDDISDVALSQNISLRKAREIVSNATEKA